MRDRDLWHRVENMDFLASYPGRPSISADNWTSEFPAAGMFEYRRYLYLAMALNSHATAPPLLSRIAKTHQQNLDTDWDAFCAAAFGRPLNPEIASEPTSKDQRAKYQNVRALYRQEFNEAPPPAFWPPPDPPVASKLAKLLVPSGVLLCALPTFGLIPESYNGYVYLAGLIEIAVGVILWLTFGRMPGDDSVGGSSAYIGEAGAGGGGGD